MLRALLKVALLVLAGIVILAWLSHFTQQDSATTKTHASLQPKNLARRLETRVLQDQLLRMGYDVQVTFVQEDDSKMIVFGKSVNRPFAHNLMARRDFEKLLHDGKFSEVTFMDSVSLPDFAQTYAVKWVSKTANATDA
jgi:hypothetical protein